MIRFLRGFVYAGKGVIACILGERNMRFHLYAAFYVLLLMPFYGFSRGEKLAVFIVIGAVISAEAFNTAVEALTNLVSPEQNVLAGLAKDAAAGGVLVSAAAAAAVGVTLYFDRTVMGDILSYFGGHSLALTAFILSVIAWIGFICAPLKKKTGAHRETKNENNDH